jgi:hypothetical protein
VILEPTPSQKFDALPWRMLSFAPVAGADAIVELLDDDVVNYSLKAWQKRNIEFYAILIGRKLVDPAVVSVEAQRRLTETLIHYRVGAAIDSQNAGHVRAQNENVVHYAIAAHVPRETLTIALTAGFIHDLNKAVGEPLRTDELAVRDPGGGVVPVMTTIAQIVGLNHLGLRTHRALEAVVRANVGLDEPTALRVDRCIVHHGLGSSQFIRDLVDGRNPWWGAEFVDPVTKIRKLVHPPQPSFTLESVIHDLADSTQQMQGGGAWMLKYPAGYWAASGRSFASMISGDDRGASDGIPMSLRHQIDVETTTCREIIGRAIVEGLIDPPRASALHQAVDTATSWSREWIDDSKASLAVADGRSVYHDVGRSLGISPFEAATRLAGASPGTPEGDALEELIWMSGRRVDSDRARGLANLILDA